MTQNTTAKPMSRFVALQLHEFIQREGAFFDPQWWWEQEEEPYPGYRIGVPNFPDRPALIAMVEAAAMLCGMCPKDDVREMLQLALRELDRSEQGLNDVRDEWK